MPIIEKRYAQALLNSSKTKEETSLFKNGLSDISNLFKSNLQFKKILLDPRIGSDIKISIIKEIFPEHGNRTFISFINLLIDKNRINIIEGIAHEYLNINRLLSNEIDIKIVSATALSDEDILSITDKYKKIYNADKITYNLKVDEGILGGVKVVVGNKVYDGSLRTQLKTML